MNNLERKSNSQFRICHFCFALDSVKGGVSIGVVITALQLTKYGISNEIFSSGNTRKQLVRNSSTWAKLSEIGVNARYSIAPIENEYGLEKTLGLCSKLNRILKPDLIVLHQVYTLSTFLGYRYAKRNGIPYAVFPHGSLTHYIEGDRTLIKNIAKRLIISRILRDSDAIIVTCENERADLQITLQPKSTLLPYGAEIKNVDSESEHKVASNSRNLRILFSGRFHKVKNLPLLIAAMPLLVSKFPHLILDIAGTGSDGESSILVKLIHELNIEKSVVFHGWVDRSEMEQLFRSASLLVLPSENENFALVVSEALSSGVPCVVSQFVGTSDIVARHHAGEIIEELTPESLAAAVLKVLEGDQLAYRDAAFKATREDLDWSKIALKWKALISSLAVE